MYFNRLKPCPKNVRLNDSIDSESCKASGNLSTQEESPTPRTFGTTLELIDDDDNEATVPTTPQHAVISTDQGNRRYPLRQRHPPVRLNDYVLSSIWDVQSQEGSSVRVEQP